MGLRGSACRSSQARSERRIETMALKSRNWIPSFHFQAQAILQKHFTTNPSSKFPAVQAHRGTQIPPAHRP